MKLIIEGIDGQNHFYKVFEKTVITIGRDVDNDCVIPDNTINPYHATITQEDETIRIESDSGFFYGGEEHKTITLKRNQTNKLVFGVVTLNVYDEKQKNGQTTRGINKRISRQLSGETKIMAIVVLSLFNIFIFLLINYSDIIFIAEMWVKGGGEEQYSLFYNYARIAINIILALIVPTAIFLIIFNKMVSVGGRVIKNKEINKIMAVVFMKTLLILNSVLLFYYWVAQEWINLVNNKILSLIYYIIIIIIIFAIWFRQLEKYKLDNKPVDWPGTVIIIILLLPTILAVPWVARERNHRINLEYTLFNISSEQYDYNIINDNYSRIIERKIDKNKKQAY